MLHEEPQFPNFVVGLVIEGIKVRLLQAVVHSTKRVQHYYVCIKGSVSYKVSRFRPVVWSHLAQYDELTVAESARHNSNIHQLPCPSQTFDSLHAGLNSLFDHRLQSPRGAEREKGIKRRPSGAMLVMIYCCKY